MLDLTDPQTLKSLAAQRRTLAPAATEAFQAFQQAVFAEGAINRKTKQLIAVAVAHATQCQRCIQSHTKAALRAGATPEELMEAAWISAEMRAGGAYAHSNFMLDTINQVQANRPPETKPGG